MLATDLLADGLASKLEFAEPAFLQVGFGESVFATEVRFLFLSGAAFFFIKRNVSVKLY